MSFWILIPENDFCVECSDVRIIQYENKKCGIHINTFMGSLLGRDMDYYEAKKIFDELIKTIMNNEKVYILHNKK